MRAEPAAVSRERYEGKGAAGRFYGGDTLLLMDELLRRYAGEVKLIYMDPPFLTGEQFIMRARVGAADWKAGKGSLVLPAFSDDMEPDAYYAMMRRVLEGCHSLLREDGMLFLHCDLRASARLRLIMDDIFGEKNLLNEIVWVYHTGGMARRYFSRKHDTILFYRKTGKYDFNIDAVLCPPTEPKQNHMRRHVDPDGRVYRSIRSGGRVYTYYDDDPVPPTDVWDDVSHLQQRDPQRTGYDTQKPLALLTRIVRCASREGELVFDPFAGSGTTLEAAAREGRRFLGVDMCPLVPNILRRRLEGAPWELLREAEMAEDACTVEVRRGVGFYHVALADIPMPWEMLDNWALGYLCGEELRVDTQALRTKKAPELPRELELPVYDGEIGLRLCDVRGKTYYYKLPYEKN